MAFGVLWEILECAAYPGFGFADLKIHPGLSTPDSYRVNPFGVPMLASMAYLGKSFD
jgi:hypothetical protein